MECFANTYIKQKIFSTSKGEKRYIENLKTRKEINHKRDSKHGKSNKVV